MSNISSSSENEMNNYLNSKSHSQVTSDDSVISKYQGVVVGKKSFTYLIYFEFCIWISKIPGAVGLFLRKIFWPKLFGSCGKGVFFGENITIRHPGRIYLGDRVVVSDGCVLDARTPKLNKVIEIGNDVILSNNVFVQCKGGSVKIGSFSGLGTQTIIQSTETVEIGNDVFIGPQCYITGGGNYNVDRLDIPIWKQGHKKEGGTFLGDDIWLGANVTILGGISVKSHSIIAAGAVVTKSIPEYSICMGVPARIKGTRKQ